MQGERHLLGPPPLDITPNPTERGQLGVKGGLPQRRQVGDDAALTMVACRLVQLDVLDENAESAIENSGRALYCRVEPCADSAQASSPAVNDTEFTGPGPLLRRLQGGG